MIGFALLLVLLIGLLGLITRPEREAVLCAQSR
jgi:hypothetical protein